MIRHEILQVFKARLPPHQRRNVIFALKRLIDRYRALLQTFLQQQVISRSNMIVHIRLDALSRIFDVEIILFQLIQKIFIDWN